MNRLFISAISILLASPFASSQNSTFSFLQLDVGARASALQGSFVSITNDPDAIFYNPAALATMERPRASFGYLDHLVDVSAGSFSFARSVEGLGQVGFGIVYVNYGTFTQTDELSNIYGSFTSSDLEVVGGVGVPLDEQTMVGGSIKYIRSAIAEYRSTAFAFDAGILYAIPSENITIGASIQNIGRQLGAFDGTRESLPLDIRIGITKRPQHLPVLLNLNFHKLNESSATLSDRFSAFTFGAEFLLSETVRLRVGYNNEQRRELKMGSSAAMAGFSIGGGILVRDYLVDYAFNSFGRIGGIHRFSLGINL
ncbi:MAG: type IX secretion system protein PorQ, partial [Ignavibacteriales bacterium]|nr:type IX secretion system protein PorQ [Ignavibacteriales bacterium]